MGYSKEEAIELLGVRVLVVKSMVRDVPDEEFDIPVLRSEERRVGKECRL